MIANGTVVPDNTLWVVEATQYRIALMGVKILLIVIMHRFLNLDIAIYLKIVIKKAMPRPLVGYDSKRLVSFVEK